MKSNGCVPLRNIQKCITKPQSTSMSSSLTPFSPFDTKCGKLNLMQKTSGNVFLGILGEWVFHIFPRLHSIMAGVPQYLFGSGPQFRGSIFHSSPMQHL